MRVQAERYAEGTRLPQDAEVAYIQAEKTENDSHACHSNAITFVIDKETSQGAQLAPTAHACNAWLRMRIISLRRD